MTRNDSGMSPHLQRIAMIGVVLVAASGLCAQELQADCTSKVPHYRFAVTIEQQLKTNPLLIRFPESRKRLADDANGLSFWRGRGHLSYQAYSAEDSRQHSGHAVSADLIHWRDLPLASLSAPGTGCWEIEPSCARLGELLPTGTGEPGVARHRRSCDQAPAP